MRHFASWGSSLQTSDLYIEICLFFHSLNPKLICKTYLKLLETAY